MWVQTAEKATNSPSSRCTSTAGFPASLNFAADPGATSETVAMACPPPEASCVALSEALLDELALDVLSLLDALLLDALLEAVPELEAVPLLPEPDSPPEPPQAESTDAPATLTPMALPRRMNLSREIFSVKTLLSFADRGICIACSFIRGPAGCG